MAGCTYQRRKVSVSNPSGDVERRARAVVALLVLVGKGEAMVFLAASL
jgi:hypothetical protein